MSESYVDPVLIAVSDCFVMTALERAWSRVVPRSARSGVAMSQRHRGYEIVPIHHDRVDKALDGAWQLCGVMAARHQINIDVAAWIKLLDSYTRTLIMSGMPHSPSRLLPYLAPLAVAAPESREFLAVG